MRLILHYFKVISLFFVSVSALANTTTHQQALLWQVQFQTSTVYLAASIHALSPANYPLPEAYLNAYEKADKLVVELNINALNPYYSHSLVESKTWLKKGLSLEEYLSKESLKSLKFFSQQSQTDYATLIRMRPWIIIEQLTGYQLKQTAFQTELGFDQFFLQRAQAQNKPILELETLAQQISAIADSPFASQITALELSLQQMQDEGYLEKMVDFWRRADADGLYAFVYQDVIDHPALKPMMDRLLDQRNQHMADVISLYLTSPARTQNRYFVVVGALHLSGPNSIVKRLEQKGYYVQALFNQ